MIERIINGIGLLAEGALVILAAFQVIHLKGRTWEMLLLFYGNVIFFCYDIQRVESCVVPGVAISK